MGRNRGATISLQGLQEVFSRQRLETTKALFRSHKSEALTELQALILERLSSEDRQELARSAYESGKFALAQQDYLLANRFFDTAAKLRPDHLFTLRAALTKKELELRQNQVHWRTSLIEMQRSLGIVCHKSHCDCNSHFTLASCMGLVEGLHHRLAGVEVYTLAPYQPYNNGHKWTRILRRIKSNHETELIPPVGDILSDFILQESPVLQCVDLIVPVPPSVEKYANRGFAPNDLMAKKLERRLAMQSKQLLTRTLGKPTPETTLEELSEQFAVTKGTNLSGLCVLLVEDIWTKGRTIPICAEILRSAGAECVHAVALGKTGG